MIEDSQRVATQRMIRHHDEKLHSTRTHFDTVRSRKKSLVVISFHDTAAALRADIERRRGSIESMHARIAFLAGAEEARPDLIWGSERVVGDRRWWETQKQWWGRRLTTTKQATFAAVMIQRRWRGVLGRRKAEHERQHVEARTSSFERVLLNVDVAAKSVRDLIPFDEQL